MLEDRSTRGCRDAYALHRLASEWHYREALGKASREDVYAAVEEACRAVTPYGLQVASLMKMDVLLQRELRRIAEPFGPS